MGHIFWSMRCRAYKLKEDTCWKIAWLLPRAVALFAFIRVCSATGDSPDNLTYTSAYKAWQAGAGR